MRPHPIPCWLRRRLTPRAIQVSLQVLNSRYPSTFLSFPDSRDTVQAAKLEHFRTESPEELLIVHLLPVIHPAQPLFMCKSIISLRAGELLTCLDR